MEALCHQNGIDMSNQSKKEEINSNRVLIYSNFYIICWIQIYRIQK